MGSGGVGRDRGASWAAQFALAAVLGGVLLNLLFNVAAVSTGADFPYSSFLFRPDDRFADFFKLAFSYPGSPVQQGADSWGMGPLMAHHQTELQALKLTKINHFHVPPVPTLLALAIRELMQWIDPVVVFLATFAGLLGTLFLTVLRLSPAGGRTAPALATVALLSYPTLFAVDRGHLFSLVCATATIAATIRTCRDRRADFWSIVMFAIAANVRPNVGLVPFALFLAGKISFRSAVLLGLVSIALFASALAVAHSVYPEYTFATFRLGLQQYAKVYVGLDFGYLYGSSLYGMLSATSGFSPWNFVAPLCVAALLAVFAVIDFRRGVLRPSEFLFLILSAYALGSQIFVDYHLLVFVIPLIMMARENRLSDRGSFAALIGCCLVLMPKNYVFVPHGDHPWSWQVVANPMILLIASGVIVANAWRRERLEALRPVAA